MRNVPLVPHVPRENSVPWDEIDWRTEFEERAGILEFDGGFSREEAEKMAEAQVRQMRVRLSR